MIHDQGPEFTAPPFQAFPTCDGIEPMLQITIKSHRKQMLFVSTPMVLSTINFALSLIAILFLRILVVQLMLLILPLLLLSLLHELPPIQLLEFHQEVSHFNMLCFIQLSFWPLSNYSVNEGRDSSNIMLAMRIVTA
jgi:hypothetical protein